MKFVYTDKKENQMLSPRAIRKKLSRGKPISSNVKRQTSGHDVSRFTFYALVAEANVGLTDLSRPLPTLFTNQEVNDAAILMTPRIPSSLCGGAR